MAPVTAAARQFTSPGRRAMLAKVHLGAKELGLRDEERRDVMERLTGHRSSADCSDDQLDTVLAHFKSLGWTARPAAAPVQRPLPLASKPVRTRATSPVAMKARAMWISLHQLGVVTSPKESALEAFGARQLKVDRLAWADAGQAYKLIEALKAMATRAGWSQDLTMVKPERHVWALKARLVQVQAQVLGRPAVQLQGLTDKQLDALAIEQGAEIRAGKAVAQP